MKLTKRGENVLMVFQLILFFLAMGILGGIEVGTIPFP
jgi:hypothetical protein